MFVQETAVDCVSCVISHVNHSDQEASHSLIFCVYERP